MNTVAKIEDLFKKKQEAQIASEIADQDFEAYLYSKVTHLRSVGRSVLLKRLGQERFRALNDRHVVSPVSRSLAWLINPSPRISIRAAQGRQTNSELVVGDFLLPIKLFQQSDRDFAKHVRKSLDESLIKFEEYEYEQAKRIIERIELHRNKLSNSKEPKLNPSE